MTNLYCYDNETIKWTHDGKDYCVHIQQETSPNFDPRDFDHESSMVCFGQYSNYGDYKTENTAEGFWRGLVLQVCSDEEIYNALVGKELANTIAIPFAEDMPDNYMVCTGYKKNGEFISEDTVWEQCDYVDTTMEEVIIGAMDYVSVKDCMILLEPHAVWLPLWIYDHSGVSMSCGLRTYPYNDRWDSSQAGWIITVTSHKEQALKQMIAEVNEYDAYLRDNVYWYTTYRKSESAELLNIECDEFADGWDYIDDCGGFIGDDIIENGMASTVGFGLEEAIKNENYTTGTAKKTVVVKWEF